MSIKVKDVITAFEKDYPLWLAEPNDPNGLHIGSLNAQVKKVMITLDVRPEVVNEAIAKDVDLLVAKHPPLFVPAQRLTEEDPQTAMYNKLIRNGINVYAAHTNIDIAPNGVNDWLLASLGIHESEYLTLVHRLNAKLLKVFEEPSKLREVKATLEAQGISKININNQQLEMVIFPKDYNFVVQLLQQEITNISQKLTVIELSDGPYEDYGIGRIGDLPEPVTLTALATKIKEQFKVDHVKLITHDTEQKVQRIAICGGSGQKFYPDAIAKGADVYITGDVYYHTAHDMYESGMPVIDAGHYIENVCKPHLVAYFNQLKNQYQWDIDFIESTVNTNPFRVY